MMEPTHRLPQRNKIGKVVCILALSFFFTGITKRVPCIPAAVWSGRKEEGAAKDWWTTWLVPPYQTMVS